MIRFFSCMLMQSHVPSMFQPSVARTCPLFPSVGPFLGSVTSWSLHPLSTTPVSLQQVQPGTPSPGPDQALSSMVPSGRGSPGGSAQGSCSPAPHHLLPCCFPGNTPPFTGWQGGRTMTFYLTHQTGPSGLAQGWQLSQAEPVAPFPVKFWSH